MSHGTFMVGSFHLGRLHTVPFETLQGAASLSICRSSPFMPTGAGRDLSLHMEGEKKQKNPPRQPLQLFPAIDPAEQALSADSPAPCTSRAKSPPPAPRPPPAPTKTDGLLFENVTDGFAARSARKTRYAVDR